MSGKAGGVAHPRYATTTSQEALGMLRRRSAFVIALSGLLLLLGSSGIALAGSRDPLPAGSSPGSSTTLTQPTGSKAPGVQPLLAVGVTPGCYGQTDQPHASGHVAGTVNVVGRTVCPTDDYVSISQSRSRWYGWQGWGSGGGSGFGRATANAAGGCTTGETYTYDAESYHEGTGAGYAYTNNSARFTCP